MIVFFLEAVALVLQTCTAWLAWRIGSVDRTFRYLSVVLALMAARRTTALLSSARRMREDLPITLLEALDRVTIPLVITLGIAHFVLMHRRRMVAWIEAHPTEGSQMRWSDDDKNQSDNETDP